MYIVNKSTKTLLMRYGMKLIASNSCRWYLSEAAMFSNTCRYSSCFIRTVVLVSKKRRVCHLRMRSMLVRHASLSSSHICHNQSMMHNNIMYNNTGWAKKRTVLRSDNFATTGDGKACNMSKVSEFCLEWSAYFASFQGHAIVLWRWISYKRLKMRP